MYRMTSTGHPCRPLYSRNQTIHLQLSIVLRVACDEIKDGIQVSGNCRTNWDAAFLIDVFLSADGMLFNMAVTQRQRKQRSSESD